MLSPRVDYFLPIYPHHLQQRVRANEVGQMDLVGEVKGCDVIMVDDMIDTAGTLTAVRRLIGFRQVFFFSNQH